MVTKGDRDSSVYEHRLWNQTPQAWILSLHLISSVTVDKLLVEGSATVLPKDASTYSPMNQIFSIPHCSILSPNPIHWRGKWQTTPVFLPGESLGQRCLVGCSSWGCRESGKTEWLTQSSSLLPQPPPLENNSLSLMSPMFQHPRNRADVLYPCLDPPKCQTEITSWALKWEL